MEIIRSYRDLVVWKKSMELVELVYKTTKTFPDDERFGLISQMRRAAVSIPSNIAEGRSRGTRKDYCQFLFHAYASGAEVETQLDIAKRLGFIRPDDYEQSIQLLTEVMKMLNSAIFSLKETPTP